MRPDAVAAATFESFGGAKGKLSWTGAARSTHYQVYRQRADESGFKLYARTDGAAELLLEDVAAGYKFKIRGVNDTNEDPFSPEITATVT